ncbi:MAG: calcium-binding protein [Caulobacteraceae bacterium]
MARIKGTADADNLSGGVQADTVRGLDGPDTLNGAGGSDLIRGGDGNDHLIGGAEHDRLMGDQGDDFLTGDNGDDTLFGGRGGDFLSGGGNDDVLWGGAGDDTLRGSGNSDVFGGSDLLIGGAGADHLIGGNGGPTDISYSDSRAGVFVDLNLRLAFGGYAEGDTFEGGFRSLTGSEFDDYLIGGANQYGSGGDDRLLAGHATYVMSGGAGADRFIVQFNPDSLFTNPYLIDFLQGTDLIDLSPVDARLKRAGDQAFTFIGTDAFSGEAGEVRYQAGGGKTSIQLNVNGDTVMDYSILVEGEITLTTADFAL